MCRPTPPSRPAVLTRPPSPCGVVSQRLKAFHPSCGETAARDARDSCRSSEQGYQPVEECRGALQSKPSAPVCPRFAKVFLSTCEPRRNPTPDGSAWRRDRHPQPTPLSLLLNSPDCRSTQDLRPCRSPNHRDSRGVNEASSRRKNTRAQRPDASKGSCLHAPCVAGVAPE